MPDESTTRSAPVEHACSADPTQNPSPFDLHLEGATAALRFSQLVASGAGLRFPWVDVDRLCGQLLPGFLVVFGARPKHGKSTFLREVFTEWINGGKTVMLLGTEQETGILRMLWACIRLQLPTSVALNPSDERHELVLQDVAREQEHLADQAIIYADPYLTVQKIVHWCRYAFKRGAHAVILDHFHRVTMGDWQEQGEAVRTLKNIGMRGNMVFLTAGQLKYGEGGPLAEFEVPGPQSWAGTGNIQREADIALQGWRPLRPGITMKEKREAKDDPTKLADLIQHQTMAIRLAAHRYQVHEENPHPARLFVNNDRLDSWSARTPGLFR